ncbi:quinol--cytochrome-c reductase, Rieske (2Fe-2S) iron-sulfur subunit [Candidatus Sulfopaludibacter sp. SbA4]|nr:quinol--cytochrome-c reductase, Rieske (2Fe-2S) iron-sulfur subunit [Candidatus Sulfopaludibacter sp. SbA4]
MPAEQRETEGTTRRSFYIGAIYGIWGIIAAALGLPAAAYLLLPPKVRKENEWFEIGDVSKLAPESPVEMTFRRNRVDGWKIISEKSTAWVVKEANHQVVAFGPQCTHLGCAYHWEESKNEFLCPCHSSVFAVDGKVVSGPAPRPLDRYETKIQGNRLLIGPLEGPPEQKA